MYSVLPVSRLESSRANLIRCASPPESVVADLLQTRLSAPRQRLLEFVRQLSGDTHIVYDKVVAQNDGTSETNRAADNESLND